MKPFYNTPERLLALRYNAAKLVGTPFAKGAMVPGAGMDCVHTVAWCYLQTGFMQKFEPPKYALDSGSHTKKSQLIKWLSENPMFTRVEEIQPGDTLCLNLRLCEHHAGLALDCDKFVHSIFFGPRKVIISTLKDYGYKRRITAIFRPIEVVK